SSRGRHTRCYRDWSSDVCSSDLGVVKMDCILGQVIFRRWTASVCAENLFKTRSACIRVIAAVIAAAARETATRWYSITVTDHLEIGRASCRDRVAMEVEVGA